MPLVSSSSYRRNARDSGTFLHGPLFCAVNGGGDMEKSAPRLVIPQLRGFYDWVEPLSWALIRLTAGLMIIPHGWPKLMMGVQATAQMALIKRGIAPAEPLAVVLIILETVGGLCVALGLFTRFFAAAEERVSCQPSPIPR